MSKMYFTGRLFECEGAIFSFEEMIALNIPEWENEEVGAFVNALFKLEMGGTMQWNNDPNSPIVTRVQ